jgi:hypothetical protein
MRGRRKGKKGRKGKSGIPIIQTATLLYPTLNAVKSTGFSETTLRDAIYNTTGISLLAGNGGPPHDFKKGLTMAVIVIGESTIGKKLANKSGVNRLIRKATGNMFQLM